MGAGNIPFELDLKPPDHQAISKKVGHPLYDVAGSQTNGARSRREAFHVQENSGGVKFLGFLRKMLHNRWNLVASDDPVSATITVTPLRPERLQRSGRLNRSGGTRDQVLRRR